MKLELDRDEVQDLREAIDTSLKGLANELAHTDVREYRRFLKQKLARFERLAADLEAAAGARAGQRPL